MSDQGEAEARIRWLGEQGPAILALAKRTYAFLSFGDEASLGYTDLNSGKERTPTLLTSGKRKG